MLGDNASLAERLIEGLMPVAKKNKQDRVIPRSYWKSFIEKLIPADMKGDMDDDLWNSIRDPSKFLATAYGSGQIFKDLQAHFFDKATSALEQLAELLWKPILGECQALQDYCNGDVPRTKPVRNWMYSYCISIPLR